MRLNITLQPARVFETKSFPEPAAVVLKQAYAALPHNHTATMVGCLKATRLAFGCAKRTEGVNSGEVAPIPGGPFSLGGAFWSDLYVPQDGETTMNNVRVRYWRAIGCGLP